MTFDIHRYKNVLRYFMFMGFGFFLSILLEPTSDLDFINCVEVACVNNIAEYVFGRNGTW